MDVCIWDVEYDPPGNELEGEYVVIINDGLDDQDMTGWKLCDQLNHCYPFPDGFELESESEVWVWTGGDTETDTDTDLYWRRTDPVWGNDGDTAYLMDDQWALMDCWSWP